MYMLNQYVIFISGIAGYAVSDNKNIITHYDKLAEIPVEKLKTLVYNVHKILFTCAHPTLIYTMS